MGSKEPKRRGARAAKIEPLESREVFSVDLWSAALGGGVEHHAVDETPSALHGVPVIEQHGQEMPRLEAHGEPPLIHPTERTADFWYDAGFERDFDELFGGLEQTLASAHNLTGAAQARAEYGFTGRGQTIAVIDSGIAWDHYALGGGYGAGYRVVGGWDFTENDANPFDDGTEGSHGTHVAGIIGANVGTSGDSGVATGVDLVGLRVFDDYGYFSWVESALRWVHTNRNAFENPITAINLSLGTSWNSTSVPSWAMLEDEFAQLEADGIFISVSAGNSFTTYNATGLSYPAASSHVVPVMSTDDSGALSYFSQRHERAIAAPGRSIRSTVPDYAGDHNGVTDDWASFSGTSMAAPYVAGASAIVREAMEFAGRTNIDQWDIYDHLMATGDSFFDAATNRTYKRLNLKNAIDALMPADDFGSSVVDAYGLGTLGTGSLAISGSIARLDDSDFFRFTASSTGKLKFTASTSHEMGINWIGCGSGNGGNYVVDVVAGQSYTIGISGRSGVGHFEIAIDFESTFAFVDWGAITQWQSGGFAINGDEWFRVEASQAGYFTAEALYDAAVGSIALEWYDENLQLAANGTSVDGGARVDHVADAGSVLFLRVCGASDDATFRLTNLVSQVGNAVNVNGTDGDDTFTLDAGSGVGDHLLSINGVSYALTVGDVSSIHFQGGAGWDSSTITGTAENETAIFSATSVRVDGASYTVLTSNLEDSTVIGGGGVDRAEFLDTAGNDTFVASQATATLSGTGYASTAVGFSLVRADATGGLDRATLHDSAGDDTFVSRPEYGRMSASAYELLAANFDEVLATSTNGGNDRAVMYDSAGDDSLAFRAEYARLYGTGYFHEARGFATKQVYATAGGQDRANFYDSAGNDEFVATPTYARMTGAGYYNYSLGFELVYAYANAGGTDAAVLYDSAGNDQFVATSDYARLSGNAFYSYTKGFESARAYASVGHDTAVLRDSTADDTFVARPEYGWMTGPGFNNYAARFDRVEGQSTAGGTDVAYFYDSSGDDDFVGTPDSATLSGAGYENVATKFELVYAYATAGGNDRAHFYDSSGDDEFVTNPSYGRISGRGYYNYAKGFSTVHAFSSRGGTDQALMTVPGAGVQATHGSNYVRISGNGFEGRAEGFAHISALTDLPSAVNVNAVDVVFAHVGQGAVQP